MKVLVVGGGRPRARDRARAARARRARPSCSARPATPGIAADAELPARSAADDVAGLVALARAERASTSSSSGPRRRSSPASSTRSRTAGIPAFGPSARGRAARGLEGLRQGADGGGRRADRRRTRSSRSREEALAHSPRSYPVVLKADGLAAGKGVIICAGRGRGARRRSTSSSPSSASARRRSCSRSSSRARSSRCSRSATARTWCRWRRRRTTSGSSTATRARTPAAWAATRRCPASTRPRSSEIVGAVHQPIVDGDGRARHPVPRRPLRRADDRPPTGRRCSSSTPASATPRRRRCCRGCAPTCVDLCRAAREPGGLAGVERRVRPRLGGDRRARLGRLPGELLEGRRDQRARRRAADWPR